MTVYHDTVYTAAQVDAIEQAQRNGWRVVEVSLDHDSASPTPPMCMRVEFEPGYDVPSHYAWFNSKGQIMSDWF